MDNNFTVVASLFAAIAAIISPTITTLINRIADIKLKKLEVFQNAKRKSYNDFADAFRSYSIRLFEESTSTTRTILSVTYQAMTYSSPKTRSLLKSFSQNIEKGKWDSVEFQILHEQFFACIDAMKAEVGKIK